MTGLILKFSYNGIGGTQVKGGICGSFFFIQKDLAVTANHVLSTNNFKPNKGFKKCQYWLLVQPDIVIELNKADLIDYPEIDTTIIPLHNNYSIEVRETSIDEVDVGLECMNEGFIGGKMPKLEVSWAKKGLQIKSCSYDGTESNGYGEIRSIRILTVNNAIDIKMNGVQGLETSYGGVVGMSGGPLINTETDEIIGLMSIGLPADVPVKKTLFAVAIKEVMAKVENVV